MRSGISAASSTSPGTASTSTSRQGAATRSPTTGRASRTDDRRELTYADLLAEVTKLANALKELGVGKGTPVGIYLGMVPEAPVAMLACARLGAPHTVVFGGFSADSLSGRLQDMGCEVLITQDEAWRRGHDGAAQAHRRRGGRRLADGQERDRPAAHRQRRADDRRAATTGGTSSRSTSQPARPSRWIPRTCSTCSTRRARPPSRRASRTRPPAISSASRRRITTSST